MTASRICLLALILLAGLLRLIGLSGHPPGFFRDEADKGYTAHLLWETGRDGAGHPYPLFVRSLKVTTSAVYQYLAVPLVAMFGLREWVVRLPAALAGTGAVWVVFLLARRWWGTTAGLVAGGFLAVSPWHLLLSRWANQSILLTLWIPLGILWCDHFMSSRRVGGKLVFGFLVSFFFAVALYTYAPARLFVPLLFFLLCLLAVQNPGRTGSVAWLVLPIFVFSVLAVPLICHILFQPEESARRFRAISVFAAGGAWEVGWLFVKNYFAHLSPWFLFLGGDANPRHSTGFPGQIQLYLAPLLAAGLWRCFRRPRYPERLLAVWFLLFPVAAACTNEGIPHALRSVFGLPVLQLISVMGLRELGDNLLPRWVVRGWGLVARKRLLSGLWAFSVAVLVLLSLVNCFWRYPARSAIYWEYGYREAVEWWLDHRDRFPRVVVSGLSEYPEVFFLFYGKLDPQTWLDTKSVPGVEFLQTGRSARDYYRAAESGAAYLVRPGELPGVAPEHVIRLPRTGEPIWLWVGRPLQARKG